MALAVSHLVGGYSQIPVLKDISFQVEPGELVGLIGLNGAGKSTTINHIIGLLTPMKGAITLNGVTLASDAQQYKQQLAYIPETPILYEELTLKEHLEMTMLAYGLDQTKAWERANKLLKTFRLDNKLDWFPANFSKGMKQKVMIVCAFLTDAKLFIIDEPFLGLDPLAVHDLLHLIGEVKANGASVLMSTHVLDTAEKFCDRFVLLHDGTIQTQGTFDEIKAAYPDAGESLNDIYLSLTGVTRDE
ncbi:ABC transporter ATP-binding protein [Lactiplantibacillus mudanjiangensis]|uniref:ABC transporter, ATP-binding protein [Lactobacillus plantarum JDM1] n=1 Tax=Lactiplantibacillus mudanjiangensis TaxID=1296538 RepID=A0A660EB04_9LACO|nr:ABC transporter ATP-binding protein [Lactiplantibacillus mudanjiangensis]VDG18362.1 ABC transporter, ATP-binding protein [Lactobacillus plantarum JDM1] [Lactiplantibacillus mudanjiangensis]VDG23767.1 ABC transporter, ATP-binding protein [Lactobacillus plantarum JDM1] [Lactiplantibacillus mudanjiangensis]VDG29705.1 ABC transporter, ATP-binding protein [Lactobacillus plantarum JDM1] [Lactiplantibacillus mudanjiangensis]VDG33622.1 ABC transporter, ATP-binding protein [Lactobacillus plantarum JD